MAVIVNKNTQQTPLGVGLTGQQVTKFITALVCTSRRLTLQQPLSLPSLMAQPRLVGLTLVS